MRSVEFFFCGMRSVFLWHAECFFVACGVFFLWHAECFFVACRVFFCGMRSFFLWHAVFFWWHAEFLFCGMRSFFFVACGVFFLWHVAGGRFLFLWATRLLFGVDTPEGPPPPKPPFQCPHPNKKGTNLLLF